MKIFNRTFRILIAAGLIMACCVLTEQLQTPAMAASPGSAGAIESASTAPYINSGTVISGWTNSDSTFGGIQIAIDGRGIGWAPAQGDAGKNTAGFASTAKTFSYTIGSAANSLTPGAHTVQAFVYWGSGTSVYTYTLTKAVSDGEIVSVSTAPYINADTVILGWTNSDSAFGGIQIAIDGRGIGWAPAQGDAGKNTAGFASTAKTFSYTIGSAANSLTPGAHTVQAFVYWGSGTSVYTYTLTKAVSDGGITSASTAPYINSGTVISGWTNSDSTFGGIQIAIDGRGIGWAPAQGDAGKNTAGFASTAKTFSYTIGAAANSLTPGAHTVQAFVYWGSGTSVYTYTLTKAVSDGGITSASTAPYINSGTVISGWTNSDSPFGGIQIAIDGRGIGWAPAQGDAGKNTAGFASTAKTFSYTIGSAANSLTPGAHTVQAFVYWESGTSVYTYTLTKAVSDGEIVSVSTAPYINADTVILGWTNSDSAFGGIQVAIDGRGIGWAEYDPYDIANTSAFASTAKRFTFNASSATSAINSLSVGAHTLQVFVYWGNGTVKYENKISKYGATVACNAQWVSSYFKTSCLCDPLPLANDSIDVYQFMRLTYVEGITAQQIDDILYADDRERTTSGYHSSTANVLLGYGQTILKACKDYDINPLYFICHMIHETGHGTSTLATGVNIGGTKYYNLLGINAYDKDPINMGAQYAKSKNWSSVAAAITGAADWVSYHYVNGYARHGGYDQNTLYEMVWDPRGYALTGEGYRYATDPEWSHLIASYMTKYSYVLNGLNVTFDFPMFY
jgi:beta-N-acetylglucosaminidase